MVWTKRAAIALGGVLVLVAVASALGIARSRLLDSASAQHDGDQASSTPARREASPPSSNADREAVYFISDRDGGRDVYCVPAEGGDVRRVSLGKARPHDISLSSDGATLVGIFEIGEHWWLCTSDTDGKNLSQLCEVEPYAGSPVLSQDGSTCYFAGDDGVPYSCSVTSGQVTALVPKVHGKERGGMYACGLAVTPDGGRLLLSWSEKEGDFLCPSIWSIGLATAEASELIPLPGGTAMLTGPAVNRAGTHLAYEAVSYAEQRGIRKGEFGYDGPSRVFVTGIDGSGTQVIGEGGDPAFSADGARVAFVREGHIFTAEVDGSDVVQLTAGGGRDYSPSYGRMPIALARRQSR